jgi:hypothetical protein
VLDAIFHKKEESFKAIDVLCKLTNVPIHPALAGIAERKIIHKTICEPDDICNVVTNILEEKDLCSK